MGESGGRMIKRKKKAMCVRVLVMSDSFVTAWTVACWILCPWDFPGKNTGEGCHFLLQGIFLPPGIKPQSLASLALCHLGSKMRRDSAVLFRGGGSVSLASQSGNGSRMRRHGKKRH